MLKISQFSRGLPKCYPSTQTFHHQSFNTTQASGLLKCHSSTNTSPINVAGGDKAHWKCGAIPCSIGFRAVGWRCQGGTHRSQIDLYSREEKNGFTPFEKTTSKISNLTLWDVVSSKVWSIFSSQKNVNSRSRYDTLHTRRRYLIIVVSTNEICNRSDCDWCVSHEYKWSPLYLWWWNICVDE